MLCSLSLLLRNNISLYSHNNICSLYFGSCFLYQAQQLHSEKGKSSYHLQHIGSAFVKIAICGTWVLLELFNPSKKSLFLTDQLLLSSLPVIVYVTRALLAMLPPKDQSCAKIQYGRPLRLLPTHTLQGCCVI